MLTYSKNIYLLISVDFIQWSLKFKQRSIQDFIYRAQKKSEGVKKRLGGRGSLGGS